MQAQERELSQNLQENTEYLVVYIAGQMFGIPVLQIQDVLGEQKVTPVPLAPPEVSGALNLRGRIVTAINVRKRLGLEQECDKDNKSMSVVVENGDELYSLIIDKVGDVLVLGSDTFETTPNTLDGAWRDVAMGIHRLEDQLMVVMDVARLLQKHD